MRLTAPLLLLSSATLAFAGAPIAHVGGPAVCNAKHKRPANLYGSVLSEGLKPDLAAAAPATGAGAMAKPATAAAAPGAKPTQVSRATLKASFAPCGEGDRG